MRRQLLDRFSRRLDGLEHTQKRAENLFVQAALRKRDAEAIYEGLFLRAITAFEAFLEEYFYLLVDQKAGFPQRARVGCRLTVKSAKLEPILLQGKKYLDWLPFDRTKERANLFLHGGRPFSTMAQIHVDAIHRSVVLRHAIAHSGEHAKRKFRTVVLQNLVLRPDEQTPAGFLRNVAIHPDVRRFNLMLANLRAAAIALTS
jgi:hypothetical protein